MASSPIPEIVPLRAPQGLHLVLSVGVSAVFWNLMVFWVSGASPNWPLAPLGLVYSLALGLWAPWSQRTHQGPLLRLWLWLVLTLLLYGALSLAEGLPWPETFGFAGVHGLWFAVAFVQGQLTMLWASQLASRGRLYQLIQGLPSGRELESRVRDFQLDADFSRTNEAALSGSLAVLSALAVLAATFSPFGRDGLSALLAGGFVAASLLVGVLLRVYRREMEALMYGRRFSLAEKVAPLGWSLLLLALAALLATVLMATGGPWVDWNSLLQSRPQSLPPPPVESNTLEPQAAPVGSGNYRLAVLLALLQILFRFHHLTLVFETLLRVVVALAPWAVAAFLLWPLVRWVLSGGRETRGLGRRWWQLLVQQWKEFWAAVAGWLRRPVVSLRQGAESSTPREWIRSLFRRPTASHRAPYPALVEAFLRLVAWADPVTAYRHGETTREYLDRLAVLLPPSSASLGHLRDLLDRELFGASGLDAGGRQEFLARVAALTAQPPSHDSSTGVS